MWFIIVRYPCAMCMSKNIFIITSIIGDFDENKLIWECLITIKRNDRKNMNLFLRLITIKWNDNQIINLYIDVDGTPFLCLWTHGTYPIPEEIKRMLNGLNQYELHMLIRVIWILVVEKDFQENEILLDVWDYSWCTEYSNIGH